MMSSTGLASLNPCYCLYDGGAAVAHLQFIFYCQMHVAVVSNTGLAVFIKKKKLNWEMCFCRA